MYAGEIYAPRRIRLIDAPEPKLQPRADGEPGWIIFQPELGCLCGSDLLYFERDYPEYPPIVGHSLHELIGVVVETSSDRFRPGDRVLCIPEAQRGLAQRFAVSARQAIPLDTRRPREEALMAQPLGTILFAMRKLPNVIGWNVAVMGQGPIGQLFCATLRNLGVRQIIAIDPLAPRLAMSPRMGATAVINPESENVVERVRDLTDGALADMVVQAVGHRDHALNLCIDLCRPEGRILNFGLTEERIDGVHWLELQRRNVTVHATIGPDFERDFPLAMRWISEGRIDVAPIITHRFDLSNIQEAFETFRERRDGALKVLVDFSPDSAASTIVDGSLT